MKKKLIPFLVGSIVISLVFSSCFYGIRGNRNVVKSERQVEIFESISASAGIDVILTQDSVAKVVVEADDNLQENIKTEVSNGELKIYPEKQIRSCKAKRVCVSFKTVHAIDGSSGADIKSTSRLRLPILEISASSGANIDLAVEGDGLTAESSSGGVINLTGTVNNLSVDGSSGARIKAPDFQSKTCNAGASSGATIKISVSEKIIAKASSGGNISVNGNPKEREVEKSSGGSVSFK